jgi:putative Mg2+ transporter-C (MgtC) family protein
MAFPDALWMVMHMAFAVLLGWLVGYERYAHGRAAGSQVYCLVCATSCAVTLLAGHPTLWYGGASHETTADPTRVTGAILTGLGFLGAGIIIQTGTSVRGLTTAALIWGTSAIGILVGAEFYWPAMGLTAWFVVSVALVPVIERRLPARVALAGKFRFREGYVPHPDEVHRFLTERGLTIPKDGISLGLAKGTFEIDCIIYCEASTRHDTMNRIAVEMSGMDHLESFTVAQSSRG